MAAACTHAREAPGTESVSPIGRSHPKQRAESGGHFVGLEVNNGARAHPVLLSRAQGSVLMGGEQSEDVSYILSSGVGTQQQCGHVLCMLTFEIPDVINVPLSLPSFFQTKPSV